MACYPTSAILNHAGKSIGVLAVILTQTRIKPRAGIGPLPLGGPPGKPKEDGGIFQGKPREKTQVHQPGRVGVLHGKLAERFIQCNQLLVTGVQGDFDLVEIDAAALTASFGTLLVACAIEENPPHGFGRRREKMSSA